MYAVTDLVLDSAQSISDTTTLTFSAIVTTGAVSGGVTSDTAVVLGAGSHLVAPAQLVSGVLVVIIDVV